MAGLVVTCFCLHSPSLTRSLVPPSSLSPSLFVPFFDCLISSHKTPVINLIPSCFLPNSISYCLQSLLVFTSLSPSFSLTSLPHLLFLLYSYSFLDNLHRFTLFSSFVLSRSPSLPCPISLLLHYVFLPTSHLVCSLDSLFLSLPLMTPLSPSPLPPLPSLH